MDARPHETDIAVSYATEKCVKYAARFDSPVSAAIDFFEVLKKSHALNDREIAEVARRVIDKLEERAHRARFLDDASDT